MYFEMYTPVVKTSGSPRFLSWCIIVYLYIHLVPCHTDLQYITRLPPTPTDKGHKKLVHTGSSQFANSTVELL